MTQANPRVSAVHAGACACCSGAVTVPTRRGLLRGAGTAALLALMPRFGLAAEGNYEAMILACIDPRLQAGACHAAKQG
jgi:hypothetical protein